MEPAPPPQGAGLLGRSLGKGLTGSDAEDQPAPAATDGAAQARRYTDQRRPVA